jgi:hypoxanthine phosphoribosyltransferase
MNTQVPSHPSYDQIHESCQQLCQRLVPVELVIGLSRGGLIPGVIMSHLLNIPFKPLEYSSSKGQGDKYCNNEIPDWIKLNSTPKTVCLIDDIADSGHTMLEVTQILQENNFRVVTAALYFKTTSVFIPQYYEYKIPENFGWVYFPWEITNK